MSAEIEQVELSITDAKKAVERAQSLDKLFSNREFRKIVLEGYFDEEAKRLVAWSGEANIAAQRSEIFLEMQAISKLRTYFRNITTMGDLATQSIAEDQAVLDELRNEEAA